MAVLMALAIIALPMMFDMERPEQVRVTEEIPPRPVLPAVQPVEPKPVETLDKAPVPVSDMYSLKGPAEPVLASPSDKPALAKPEVAKPEVAKPEVAKPELAKPKPAAVMPAAPGGKLDDRNMPEGWVVQVAAMSDQAKADIMIKQLREKGFRSFSMPGRTSTGKAVRVFIGPKLDKAEAMKIKQSVDATMGLQTMVVPYSVK
jgi:DedD protein